MSKSKAISRPFEQTTQQRAELDALQRMLDISEGTFSLSVAICNSPALRDHIIEHVTGQMEGIEVVRVPEDARDIFDLVRKQIPNGSPRAIFVVDLEKALEEDKRSRVLQGLNVSREQWQSAFKRPVVFWLPEYVTSLVMTQARDLWSWVSHSFEFVSEPPALVNFLAACTGNALAAANLDVHEKHIRIAELEQRIASVGNKSQGQLKAHFWMWLQELAHLYFCIGELDKAEQALQRSLTVATPANSRAISQSLHELGIVHQLRGDYGKALESYEQSLRIAEELGDDADIAGSLHQIGGIYYLRSSYDKALEYSERAREISQKLGTRAGLSKSLQQIGIIHFSRGDYDKALKYFEQARAISEELSDRADISAILHDIGAVHQTHGDHSKALDFYEQSRKIKEELGDRMGIAASLYQISTVYEARGDSDKALEYCERAKRIQEEIGDRAGFSKSLHAIGIIHQRRGEYDKALACYRQSLSIAEELGDLAGLVASYGQIARVCIETNQYSEALEHLVLALAISAQIGSPQGRKAVHELRKLRQAWGPDKFDRAWRTKTREEVPDWLNADKNIAITHEAAHPQSHTDVD